VIKLILDDLKTLLNTDASKDPLLTLYIRKAIALITNYLNSSTVLDIENLYPDAIIEYVTLCYNKRGNEGMKQFSQGSRSGTYEDGLSNSVIALLPVPYATLLQTTIDQVAVILP